VNDDYLDIGVYEQTGTVVLGDPASQEELNRADKARLEEL